MNRWAKAIIVGTICLNLSGCLLGTAYSRSGGENSFGKYPYMAIAVDVKAMGSPAAAGWGVLSIPLDLVIDTVLMPVDLVLWPLGYTKEKIKGGGP